MILKAAVQNQSLDKGNVSTKAEFIGTMIVEGWNEILADIDGLFGKVPA